MYKNSLAMKQSNQLTFNRSYLNVIPRRKLLKGELQLTVCTPLYVKVGWINF